MRLHVIAMIALVAGSGTIATVLAQGTGSEPQPGLAEEPPAPPGGLPWLSGLLQWAEESYRQEPGLAVAVALLLAVLPVLSLAAFLLVRARRASARRAAQKARAPRPAPAVRPGVVLRPALELLEEPPRRQPLTGPLVRIGRHEENDVRLASKTVHRYHAVLHLTPDQGYVITDLSGPEGNGVYVNSRRIEHATLAPGDMIELGEVRLRFQLEEAR